MNDGNAGTGRKIMMGSPAALSPDDTLDPANDIISPGRIRHTPIVDYGKWLACSAHGI